MGVIARMAVKSGIISKDSIGKAVDKKEYRTQIATYMQKEGINRSKN